MTEARVKGGLLDRILSTPLGEVVLVSPAEARGICDAVGVIGQGPRVALTLIETGETMLLGRTIRVSERRTDLEAL
jgi:chorismate-pyruvate lyase